MSQRINYIENEIIDENANSTTNIKKTHTATH